MIKTKPVTRVVRNYNEMRALQSYLGTRNDFPLTVTITQGEKRSQAQNRLQRQWCNDAASQGDQTAEEYRGFVKLHFGVAILKHESETFAAAYDELIKPLPYETKLRLMMEPHDYPITRDMSVKGKSEFLNQVWDHFTSLGFQLTDPSMIGLECYWTRN